MTNIILLIFTSVAGFLFGRVIERNNSRLERFFFDLTSFCRQMQNNVTFFKLPLSAFFEKFKFEADESFNRMFLTFLSDGVVRAPFLLNKQQKIYLERFLIGLNGANTAECLNHLEYFLDYFSKQLTVIQVENGKRAKLYQKLGLLIGVIVGIMLI